MPVTYNLIASNTLSSAAASVTFSAIPGTYTDLLIKMSVRCDDPTALENIWLRFNSDTANNYSQTTVRGNSSSALSSNESSQSRIRIIGGSSAAGATSNTFSNNEIYIPSYTVSQNKPMSQAMATENNSGTAFESNVGAQASLWRNTAAITSVTLLFDTGGSDQFVSGSSFFLYGIKNS